MLDQRHTYDPVHVIKTETMLGTVAYIYTEEKHWPNMVDDYFECRLCEEKEDGPSHVR